MLQTNCLPYQNINVRILNAFEIQTIWEPTYFRPFKIRNVRFSDPHCTLFCVGVNSIKLYKFWVYSMNLDLGCLVFTVAGQKIKEPKLKWSHLFKVKFFWNFESIFVLNFSRRCRCIGDVTTVGDVFHLLQIKKIHHLSKAYTFIKGVRNGAHKFN